ncbi:hypothetical protein Gotur_006590 [Gossypium turneri]
MGESRYHCPLELCAWKTSCLFRWKG